MNKTKEYFIEKRETINKIIEIISEFGEFNIADVEAESSPIVGSEGKLVFLMEEFKANYGIIRTYDTKSSSCDEIDEYIGEYEDMELDQIEYTLELAEKWKVIAQSENKSEELQSKLNHLIDDFNKAIEVMPQKGDSIYTCQKVALQSAINELSSVVNGIESDDFIEDDEY